MTVHLPTIPATCGECDSFDSWNDGTCTVGEFSDDGYVNAEKHEAPPPNCPKRHACTHCGRYGDGRREHPEG